MNDVPITSGYVLCKCQSGWYNTELSTQQNKCTHCSSFIFQ